jgi:hypothetical protein
VAGKLDVAQEKPECHHNIAEVASAVDVHIAAAEGLVRETRFGLQ